MRMKQLVRMDQLTTRSSQFLEPNKSPAERRGFLHQPMLALLGKAGNALEQRCDTLNDCPA